MSTHTKGKMPLLWFGVFEKPFKMPDKEDQYTQSMPDWRMDMLQPDYQQKIQSIRHEIAQGNVYQVNYTVRLNAKLTADNGYAYYKKICEAQQANYCAYLDIGNFQLLSASPELFFHWQSGTITTKPMKGTISRGKTLAEDKIQANTLACSTKDQAENLMSYL